MSILTLEKLVSMDKKQLEKLKKDEIVSAINSYGYQLTSARNEAKQERDKLIKEKKGQEAVKELLAGFAGVDLERDDYSGEPKTKLSLSEIAGKAIQKFYLKQGG